jgi:hypothetical protein
VQSTKTPSRVAYCISSFYGMVSCGSSKQFPGKLQVLLIRAIPFGKTLAAKCFIYDVVRSVFFFVCLLALAKTYSFVIFGLSVGLSELQMCMAFSIGLFPKVIIQFIVTSLGVKLHKIRIISRRELVNNFFTN